MAWSLPAGGQEPALSLLWRSSRCWSARRWPTKWRPRWFLKIKVERLDDGSERQAICNPASLCSLLKGGAVTVQRSHPPHSLPIHLWLWHDSYADSSYIPSFLNLDCKINRAFSKLPTVPSFLSGLCILVWNQVVSASSAARNYCSVMSSFLQPHGLKPAWLLCPWDSPGKNTGVGCCALLQGIFLTQGSNSSLLHCRQVLHYLNHQQNW